MSALKSHGHITDTLTFTRIIEIRNDHAFTLLFYYNINIHIDIHIQYCIYK